MSVELGPSLKYSRAELLKLKDITPDKRSNLNSELNYKFSASNSRALQPSPNQSSRVSGANASDASMQNVIISRKLSSMLQGSPLKNSNFGKIF